MKLKVKLFMACVVALALVCGMGGISFADDAAEVVVQVSYPSGKNYVSFYNGAVGGITDATKDYYVNVHVTLLDANGDPATAGPSGELLGTLTATLTSDLGLTDSIVKNAFLADTETLTFDITNVGPAARAHVKYACTTACDPGDDTLEVTVGTLDPVTATVDVRAPKATSFVLRTLRVAGAGPVNLFDAITAQSNNAGVGALAGDDIYFEVWAVEGVGSEFTTAPELEGQTITVSAYPDYDADGSVGDMAAPYNAAVDTTTATMSGGKATGTINLTTAGTVETGGVNPQMRVALTATTGGTRPIATSQPLAGGVGAALANTSIDWVGMRPKLKNAILIGTNLAEGNLVTEKDVWFVIDDSSTASGPTTTLMGVFVVDEYGNPCTESLSAKASLTPVANAAGATPTFEDYNDTVLTSTATASTSFSLTKGATAANAQKGLAVPETAAVLNNQQEATGGGTSGRGAPLKGILTIDDAGLNLTSDSATVFLVRTDKLTGATGSGQDLDLRLSTAQSGSTLTAGDTVTLYITSASGSAGNPTTSEIVEYNDSLVIKATAGGVAQYLSTTAETFAQATSAGLTVNAPLPNTTTKHIEIPVKLWGPCVETTVTPVSFSLTDVAKGITTAVDMGPTPPIGVVADLEPSTETNVAIASLAANVYASTPLSADPIVITSYFTVGENGLLPANTGPTVSVNTADAYNNTVNGTPIYSAGADVGMATVDPTGATSIFFDAADVGETATVTINVPSVPGITGRTLQIINIQETTSSGSLQCNVEGPGVGTPGGEVIVQVNASTTTFTGNRAIKLSFDTANSVTGSEMRDFNGSDEVLPVTKTLNTGANQMIRVVVSAPEEGDVVLQGSDVTVTTSPLLDTLTDCTIKFAVDDEDPEASCAANNQSDPATAEIVITVTDNIGVSLGGTAYTIEQPAGTDITSTLSCVNAGDGTTTGTITCSKAAGGLDEGVYEVSVTPKDLVGNEGAETTCSLTIATCIPTVTISPATAALEPGDTQQFTASTSCDGSSPAGTYTWDIMTKGCTGSSIDATGLYTAPATITGASCTDLVRATDITNGGEGTAPVTVAVPPTTTTTTPVDTLTVSPDPVRRSRWVMLPTLMVLQGTSDFVRFGADRSRVSYSPANAVVPMPRVILGPQTMWQLVFVNPPWLAGGATDGTLTVTVTTGAETVTGDTTIQMLPLGLDK